MRQTKKRKTRHSITTTNKEEKERKHKRRKTQTKRKPLEIAEKEREEEEEEERIEDDEEEEDELLVLHSADEKEDGNDDDNDELTDREDRIGGSNDGTDTTNSTDTTNTTDTTHTTNPLTASSGGMSMLDLDANSQGEVTVVPAAAIMGLASLNNPRHYTTTTTTTTTTNNHNTTSNDNNTDDVVEVIDEPEPYVPVLKKPRFADVFGPRASQEGGSQGMNIGTLSLGSFTFDLNPASQPQDSQGLPLSSSFTLPFGDSQ
eukprot:TRINITY_DN7953_c0_g1_i1.p1 TRINITY_DN7953_c0_g1~~TRINITY_DN7953_c0_g1_i1.p1  ORF type:complete len:260 (-),score=103.92 TRINITY_DN7953_c0_g1_i1:29-808(-)